MSGETQTKEYKMDTLTIKKIATEFALSYQMPFWADTVGVRYDNRVLSAGDELDFSRDNSERADAREFPQFEDDDYNDLPCLDGTSCYLVAMDGDDEDDLNDRGLDYLAGQSDAQWDHCSIVIGKRSNADTEDDGEILLSNCEVAKVLW